MTDIALPAASLPGRGFRIGAAIGGAFGALRHNWLLFGVVTSLAALPNLLWSDDVNPSVTTMVLSAIGAIFSLAAGQSGEHLVRPAIGAVLGLGFGALSQVIVIDATLAHLRARPVRLAASLGTAQRVFLRLIGAQLLVAVLSTLGLLAVVVPGLILMTMWFVAIPACAVEHLGVWKVWAEARA